MRLIRGRFRSRRRERESSAGGALVVEALVVGPGHHVTRQNVPHASSAAARARRCHSHCSRGSVVTVLGRALVVGVTAIAGEHDLGARQDVQVAGGARPGSVRGDYDGSLFPAAPAVTETTAYKLSNNRPTTPTRCTQRHASRNPGKAGSADLVDVEGDDDTAVNGIRALVGMDGAIGLPRGEPGGDDITRDRHDGQGVPCGRAEAADEAAV